MARTQHLEKAAGGVLPITEALMKWRPDNSFVFPPARYLFQLPMGFASHAQVKVTHQTQFLMNVNIAERGQHGLAQAQGQRTRSGRTQAHFEFPTMPFEAVRMHTVPEPCNLREMLVKIDAGEEGDRAVCG